MRISEASTDEEIARCHAVMKQLRPHIPEGDFLPTVRLQMAEGYRLAYLESDGAVGAVAGYRFIHNLAGGHILYVDDLITEAAGRSRGHGRRLFDWLSEVARREGCAYLELDSGVQRFEAHRFYFVNRMVISSHHFRLPL